MTTINLSIDSPFRVVLAKGVYGDALLVDWPKFTDEVNDYVYAYGLKQVLNDAMSEKKDKKTGAMLSAEDIRAKAIKKLEALYAGDVRIRGEGESGDPVLAEFAKEARKTVMAGLNAAKAFDKCPKKTENRFMWGVNFMRQKAGKPQFANEAEYWTYFAELPVGKDLMAQAAVTVAKRKDLVEEAAVELF